MKANSGWVNPVNDIAVLSLAQPVANITPVRLLTLQPGQAGFQTVGTTITLVGYGAYGTGSQPPKRSTPSAPTDGPSNDRRRVATSSLGLYGNQFGTVTYLADVPQAFFVSQFRNPQSPGNPNDFNLQVPTTPLEGGVAPGDSGGPLFAMVNGQLTQIGVTRVGSPITLESNGTKVELWGYSSFNDWTPINLFLQWVQQNDPLRDVTAAPGNFNWSNPSGWIDSVPGVVSGVPNNTVN